jgi:lysophospholipase L1-like esterase
VIFKNKSKTSMLIDTPTQPCCKLKAALWVLLLVPALACAAPATLAVLGSSTAAGTGASETSRSWVGLLQAWLAQSRGLSVINLATPGVLTDSAVCATAMSAEFRQAIAPVHNVRRALRLDARYLILSFPSNDATHGIPAQRTIAQLLNMQQCAQRTKGVKVAVMSSLPRSGLSPQENVAIAQVDAVMHNTFGACYIDVKHVLSDASGLNPRHDLSAGDGIHFNDAGHAVIFGVVKQFIEEGQCF